MAQYPDEIQESFTVEKAIRESIEQNGGLVVHQDDTAQLIGVLVASLFSTCDYIRSRERAN